MSTPHRCPVCHGRGTVPENFYSRLGVGANSNDLTMCRACSGAGALWLEAPAALDGDVVRGVELVRAGIQWRETRATHGLAGDGAAESGVGSAGVAVDDRASDAEHEREEAVRARVHAALAELEALANDRGAWSPSDAITHVDRAEELYGMLCRTVYRDDAADCLACLKDRALDVLIAAQHARDAAQRRADADLAPRLVLMGRAGELRAELRRLADRANDLARAVGPEREWRDVDPVAVQELVGRLDAELVRANDVLARCPTVEGE